MNATAVRKSLATIAVAAVVLLSAAPAAGAATVTVPLSVRMTGHTLIVNVAGVKHTCVAVGGFELGGLHARCSTGTGATWNGNDGGTMSSLTVTVGHARTWYSCTPTQPNPSQLRCLATVK